MWKSFTSALSNSTSSFQVTVVNSSVNTIVTGVLGSVLFNEVLGVDWAAGSFLILVGSLLMNSDQEDKDVNKVE